jgi:hypothetical protein
VSPTRFQIWLNTAPASNPPPTLVAIDNGMYSAFEVRLMGFPSVRA